MEALQAPLLYRGSKQSVREPIQGQGIFLLISILSLSTFVSVCVYLCFSGSFLLCAFSLSFSLIKSYCNSGNVDTFYTFWKIKCLSKVYETPFKFSIVFSYSMFHVEFDIKLSRLDNFIALIFILL